MTTQSSDKQLDVKYNTVNFFVLIKGGASKFVDFVEKVFDAHENEKARTPDKDGTLIHAEVQIGDSMILVADSKKDWPFTPAFPQVYVDDSEKTLRNAEDNGATVITKVSPFYHGLTIARFKDPWQNIWWLFSKSLCKEEHSSKTDATTDWHEEKPSYIYTSIMEAMKNLEPRS